MKKFTCFLIFSTLVLAFGVSSCDKTEKEKVRYPIIMDLGERTCTGDISWLPLPPTSSEEPPLPGLTLALKSDSGDYFLTHNGKRSVETITIEDVTYTLDAGDRVEITGTVRSTKISPSKEYFELEIESLKRVPITTVLGERTCTGKIVALPNPPDGSDEPILPGEVLGLETESGSYLLTFGGKWIREESATVGGEVYALDDRVKITGMASRTKVSASDEYLELEVVTIEKAD